jgi:4-hydroxy-3-methylbut-2-enyl diphosphate reductase
MLSKRRLDAAKNWDVLEAAAAEHEILEGFVTEENKGGLIVMVKGIRVFVPASQAGLPKDTTLTSLVRTKVKLCISEISRGRNAKDRIVGSIRAATMRARGENMNRVWSDIEVGKQYSGVVKSITSYGAFIDIGGIDGLAHVSALSWSRVRHPGDILSVGQEVQATVIALDHEKKKISLSTRNEAENPWSNFVANYKEGDTVEVKILKLVSYGAFAHVADGVDGLIHISQIAEKHVENPADELTEGELVRAKITAIDNEKHKVSLSLKQAAELSDDEYAEEVAPTLAAVEAAETHEAAEPAEPAEAAATETVEETETAAETVTENAEG